MTASCVFALGVIVDIFEVAQPARRMRERTTGMGFRDMSSSFCEGATLSL